MQISALLFHKFTRVATLIAALLVVAASPVAAQNSTASGNDRVKAKFKSSCAACHGQDGAGTALGKSMNAPDLRSDAVQKHSDAELAKVIAEGKGDMPSFDKSLTEDQIRGLVQYIRGLANKKESTRK